MVGHFYGVRPSQIIGLDGIPALLFDLEVARHLVPRRLLPREFLRRAGGIRG